MDIKKILIKEDSSIRETMQAIQIAGYRIALVLDSNEKILGIVTDGDIRRGILRDIGINESVKNVINRKFIYATTGMAKEEIMEIMKSNDVDIIPLIDEDKKVKDVLLLKVDSIVSYKDLNQ